MKALFEIEFVDGTKVWAHLDRENNVNYGTLGKGINLTVKEILENIEFRYLCSFAENYSKKSKFVSSFKDNVEEESNKLQAQLLKAF